jgi:hypothetical protein
MLHGNEPLRCCPEDYGVVAAPAMECGHVMLPLPAAHRGQTATRPVRVGLETFIPAKSPFLWAALFSQGNNVQTIGFADA